jgi:hypothetical protein
MLEYHTVDKSAWERGPWDAEPDKAQWTDEATGLPCLMVRGPHGALCGYVGVNPGHPWHGKGYDDCTVYDGPDDDWDRYPSVHGGLTYADGCSHGDPARSICHIPAPGQPDDVWWLGFDCAHAGDYSGMKYDEAWRVRFPPGGDVYRDFGYVRSECQRLASQAARAAQGMSAGTAETAQQAQGEARQPGPDRDAPE